MSQAGTEDAATDLDEPGTARQAAGPPVAAGGQCEGRDPDRPFVDLPRTDYGARRVFVLVAGGWPARGWERMPRDDRGNVLESVGRRHPPAVVCRMPFPVSSPR